MVVDTSYLGFEFKDAPAFEKNFIIDGRDDGKGGFVVIVRVAFSLRCGRRRFDFLILA